MIDLLICLILVLRFPSVCLFVGGNCWVPYWDIFPRCCAHNIGVCVQMKLKTHYPRPRSVASHLACWSHDSILTLVTGERLMSQLIFFLVRSHLLNLINRTLSMKVQVQISVFLSVFIVQDILGQCSNPKELCSACLLICWKTHLSKILFSCCEQKSFLWTADQWESSKARNNQ